jgi:hypothetical protein
MQEANHHYDMTNNRALMSALLEKDADDADLVRRVLQEELPTILEPALVKFKLAVFKELLGMKALVLTELAAIKEAVVPKTEVAPGPAVEVQVEPTSVAEVKTTVVAEVVTVEPKGAPTAETEEVTHDNAD